jgi:ankyrin repeat protein
LEENGLNIKYRFADGGTLLHHYLREKSRHTDNGNYVKFLLDRKISVNAKDNSGSTALFYALENG